MTIYIYTIKVIKMVEPLLTYQNFKGLILFHMIKNNEMNNPSHIRLLDTFISFGINKPSLFIYPSNNPTAP